MSVKRNLLEVSWTRRTFCSKAGVCGVGVFWSRFSDLEFFFLEILFPLVLVLLRLRHCENLGKGKVLRYWSYAMLYEKYMSVDVSLLQKFPSDLALAREVEASAADKGPICLPYL